MIQLPNLALPQVAQAQLNKWQSEIDRLADYAKKVDRAKREFAKRNKSNNATFREVRSVLIQMCSGSRRCGYCEDSVADEVEHIKPKDLYPEVVFAWENYLYACGPCNSRKNNKYAIFSQVTQQLIDITRRQGQPILPPETGQPALLDPRFEDPFNFMELDLLGTFYFLPIATLTSKDYQRADYTIETLQLNDRDYLLAAREEAFYSYEARLSQYVEQKQSGVSETELKSRIIALRRMQHPTVWQEMKRQHVLIPSLKALFARAPEALSW